MTSQSRLRESLEDFRCLYLDETPSTNSECLARAREGDHGKLWIVARKQTAGRGRRGRSWVSEPGNLYASLLLIDAAPIAQLRSLPLVVALAVYDAIRRVLPPGHDVLDIKWPNDILINRRKTCGILIDAEPLPDGRQALAIGIGINIAAAPDQSLYPVTCLVDHGCAASVDEVFACLFESMVDQLNRWDQGKGIREIVGLWRNAACGIGEKITVNLPQRSLSGRFAGINEDGFLMLDTGADSFVSIAAGDVFFDNGSKE